ncbi:hypothetical protein LZ32DRAFT_600086 [Colletotrichum eremochloae]|nr:hypothetical protein LZ32DRAFT_600086 [Colletotrichum eremochloae]
MLVNEDLGISREVGRVVREEAWATVAPRRFCGFTTTLLLLLLLLLRLVSDPRTVGDKGKQDETVLDLGGRGGGACCLFDSLS